MNSRLVTEITAENDAEETIISVIIGDGSKETISTREVDRDYVDRIAHMFIGTDCMASAHRWHHFEAGAHDKPAMRAFSGIENACTLLTAAALDTTLDTLFGGRVRELPTQSIHYRTFPTPLDRDAAQALLDDDCETGIFLDIVDASIAHELKSTRPIGIHRAYTSNKDLRAAIIRGGIRALLIDLTESGGAVGALQLAALCRAFQVEVGFTAAGRSALVADALTRCTPNATLPVR